MSQCPVIREGHPPTAWGALADVHYPPRRCAVLSMQVLKVKNERYFLILPPPIPSDILALGSRVSWSSIS